MIEKLKKFFEKKVRKKEEDFMYVIIDVNPYIKEYGISTDYLSEYQYIIIYMKGKRMIDIEPYTRKKIEELQKYFPVVFRKEVPKRPKAIYEEIIKFET